MLFSFPRNLFASGNPALDEKLEAIHSDVLTIAEYFSSSATDTVVLQNMSSVQVGCLCIITLILAWIAVKGR